MDTTYSDAPVETVSLRQGTIEYRDIGPESGDVVVFVHGVLVNGDLWRDVVDGLVGETNVRFLVPTLPLGGHSTAMDAEADLTPPGVAELLRDFLDTLGIYRVTLVGNDTGGAICQVFLAHYPERVARLVLTNCDAFENFLPPLLRPLQYGARIPGFTSLVSQSLRFRLTSWLVFAAVAKKPVPRTERDAYLEGIIRDPNVRRDFRAVLRGISSRYTIEAAATFPEYEEPVLLVWATGDLFFPIGFAERLAEAFPNTRLERVTGSRAFIPVDRPRRLAELIGAFVDETRTDGRGWMIGDGASVEAPTRQ